MTMRSFGRAFATLAAVALFAGIASAQEIKARVGTSLPDDHPQTLGAREFARLVQEKSGGRIHVSVFSSAQLGSDTAMTGALQGGTLEFTVPSTATVANLVKEFGVFGLPFCFVREQEADIVLDGPFGQRILAMLPEKGLIGLAYWENGFRNVTNSRRSIDKADDIKGIKIRTMQNSLYIDLFNGLGANAVPMAINELMTGLETRVVDGQENPYTVVYAQHFYEVQKYLTTTQHAYDIQVLLASQKFFDKLSATDKTLIQDAARESTVRQRQISRELNAKLRGELAAKGMKIVEFPDAERQKLRERVQPVIDKYTQVYGPQVVADYMAAIQQARAQVK